MERKQQIRQFDHAIGENGVQIERDNQGDIPQDLPGRSENAPLGIPLLLTGHSAVEDDIGAVDVGVIPNGREEFIDHPIQIGSMHRTTGYGPGRPGGDNFHTGIGEDIQTSGKFGAGAAQRIDDLLAPADVEVFVSGADRIKGGRLLLETGQEDAFHGCSFRETIRTKNGDMIDAVQTDHRQREESG